MSKFELNELKFNKLCVYRIKLCRTKKEFVWIKF